MNNVAHSGTQTPKVELDGHPEGDAAGKASRLFDNRDPGNLVSGLGFLTDLHPTILVLAGEASGDLHAAKLVAELKSRMSAARFLGMGGSCMRAQGVELLAELDTLAVMGLGEVLSRIPHFWKLHRKVVAAIDSESPDLVILVDYSGFNLKIARAAYERGCAVLYYIAPKSWAWNERRAQTLAAVTHRVAAILPFEVNRLKEHGVNVEYVGHPLLDHSVDIASREESFRSWGLDPQRPLLGILPGSREQEIERHLRTFSASAQVVVERRPDVQVLISQAPGLDDSHFQGACFPIVRQTPALQRWSDAILVKSGTSTLEVALERTPFLIAYRTSGLTGVVAKRLLRTQHIGLPNLVLQERVVPEVIQEEVTPEVIAPLLLELLDTSSARRSEQIRNLDRVVRSLGPPGASSRVAQMAVSLLGWEP